MPFGGVLGETRVYDIFECLRVSMNTAFPIQGGRLILNAARTRIIGDGDQRWSMEEGLHL